jgi:hypothetical protein
MLHIETSIQGVTAAGYSTLPDANFNKLTLVADTEYVSWSTNNGATGGNLQFGRRGIVTFEFNGDEMTIIAYGRIRTYKHPAILAAAPRHWYYECYGNAPLTTGEFVRLYRVWANSPKMDSLPNNSLPAIAGDLQTSGPLFLPNSTGVRYGVELDNGRTLTLTAVPLANETVTIGGQAQTMTMGLRTGNANATITGTASATVNGVAYPVTFSIVSTNTPTTVATAIAAAFNTVTAITSLYTVSASGVSVTFTRLTKAANDSTLAVTFPLQAGMPATFGDLIQKGIAEVVYTFKSALTTSGDVLIGGTATTSRDNLVAAINRSTGAGTQYHASTPLNGNAYAINETGSALSKFPYAKQYNLSTNTAETLTNGSWADKSTWKNGNPVSTSDSKHLFNGDVAVSGKIFSTPAASLTGPLFALLTDGILASTVTSTVGTDLLLTAMKSNSGAVVGSSERWEVYGSFAATAATKQIKIGVGIGGSETTNVLDFGALSPNVLGEPFILTVTKFYTGSGSGQPYVLFGKIETTTLTVVVSGVRPNTNFNATDNINIRATTTNAGDIVLTGIQKINCFR